MGLRRKTIERKKDVKLRKSFLPTFIITVILWLGVFGIIYFIDPHENGAIPLFFVAILFALFFTLSIVLINSRRGFISALAITLFIVLRYFGLGNLLNFLLLAGISIAMELYFSKKLSQ
jgi:bacteriorhodopsin